VLELIRRSYLSLAVLAASAGVPAFAATVDYTTTASFSCTPGTCVITGNNSGSVSVVYGTGADTATLMFTGSPAGTSINSDSEFTAASYGAITATYSGNGANINGIFQLMLQQTAPNMSPTTGTLGIATLSGLVFDGKSTSYANFGVSDPSISLGGPVVYELDTSQNIRNRSQFGYTIVSPSTGTPLGQGVTSFQGNVQATPEPGLLTLTGIGFVGMAGFAVRRKRAGMLK
jgi:hypothetical protein